MMFYMDAVQQYISSLLEETGFLRVDQVQRLVEKLGNECTERRARKLIGQINHMGRAFWLTEDIVSMPHLRQSAPDRDMLSAVDIMIDLLDTRPAAVSSKKPPFKLSFLIEQGGNTSIYSVCAVQPGKEKELCFRLEGNQDSMTVIFLLSNIEQAELVKTELKHFFAVNRDGRMRYFKGA